MNKIIDHQISKALNIVLKIEGHDDIKQTLPVFFHGLLNRKNNEYYVIHMLDRINHLYEIFDISDLTDNEYWKEYNKTIYDLLRLMEHLVINKRQIIDCNGNKLTIQEMESKQLVCEYYLKQELCYGSELKIKEIIPISYNIETNKLSNTILYKDLVDIDNNIYYNDKITRKYISPVLLIGIVDREKIEFKTPMSIWNDLIELITRIIRFEDKKSTSILPITIMIDTENKWIDTIRNMTLLIKKKIRK